MNIDEIAKCLLEGGVVLLPTDTVYGLAASPLFPEAVNRIYTLKSRPRKQNLPIMVSKTADMEVLGLDLNAAVQKILASSYVPGDISIVMGFKEAPSVFWLEGRDEVAVRIPNHPELLAVLDKTGPLLVTSANKHGRPNTPTQVQEILDELNGVPECVVDGGIVENIPSTIINCRVTPPVIERNGRILYEDLFNLLNNE
jgi:L-threonylcarbamoyladenylate synthase